MGNAKYQIAIAAIDQFSAPFRTASASVNKLTNDVKEQSAELSKLNTTAKNISTYADLKREIKDTSLQLDQAKTKTGKLAIEFKQLNTPTQTMRGELEAAKNELSRLENQIKSTDKPTKEMRNAFNDAKAEVKHYSNALKAHETKVIAAKRAYEGGRLEVSKLTNTYEKQRTELHALKGKLNDSGIQAHKFSEAQRQIKRDISGANAALDSQRKKLIQVNSAQANIERNKQARSELGGQFIDTALKGAAIALPVKFAIDFESAFADVKKAVNDASPEELKIMENRIIKEAPNLGLKSEELAAIITEGAKNGVEKDKLFDFAESAAKMKVAFDMTAEEAGNAMMKWRTTMNLTQDEAVNLADAVNYVGDKMATNGKEITEVLVRQGAVITNAGLDEIQATALSAAVLSGSASTEIAATATKNLLLSLTAGESASGGQKDALTALGFDPAQLAKEMQNNAPKTVEQVLLAIKEQDADVQTALMKNLFGSESIGSIAPLLQNLDNFRKSFELIADKTNYAGSMQKEFDIAMEQTGKKIGKFIAKTQGIAVVVGATVLPVIGEILDFVDPFLDWGIQAAQTFPEVTTALLGIPAAILAIKTAAIAFQTGKLLLGQGKNYKDLGKAKLGIGLENTAESADRATSRLNQLTKAIDNLGKNKHPVQGKKAILNKRTRSNRKKMNRGKLGRLINLGSTALDYIPSAIPTQAPQIPSSKWGKRAAMLGGGTALSLMTANANATDLALMGADAASFAGDAINNLPVKGALATIAGASTRLIKPIGLMLQGAALTSTIKNGTSEEIGSLSGDMAGGLGGGALGAAIGTAILPGIGTAIGGLIGGFAGGEAGEWLGGKIGALFSNDKPTLPLESKDRIKIPDTKDQLPSPDSVASQVSTTQNTQQNTFHLNITVPPSSGNTQNDEAMINKLVSRLKSEMVGIMSGNQLDIRRDGSLSDITD